GMQDAIAISLEARAPRVGSLVDRPRTGTRGSSCRRRKYRVFGVLALLAGHEFSGARTSEGIGVGEGDLPRGVAAHGRRPSLRTFPEAGHGPGVPTTPGHPSAPADSLKWSYERVRRRSATECPRW